MVCFPPLAELSRIVTSVCVLALGNLRHYLPNAHCADADADAGAGAGAPVSANVDNAALHIGAVAFINRFDSSLNGRIHFHVCVVDGVFAEVAGKHWTSRNLPFVVVGYRCNPVYQGAGGDRLQKPKNQPVKATVRPGKKCAALFCPAGIGC